LYPSVTLFQLAETSVTRTIIALLSDELIWTENWDILDCFKCERNGFKIGIEKKSWYSVRGIRDYNKVTL